MNCFGLQQGLKALHDSRIFPFKLYIFLLNPATLYLILIIVFYIRAYSNTLTGENTENTDLVCMNNTGVDPKGIQWGCSNPFYCQQYLTFMVILPHVTTNDFKRTRFWKSCIRPCKYFIYHIFSV